MCCSTSRGWRPACRAPPSTRVDGDEIKGRIKVKVGPITHDLRRHRPVHREGRAGRRGHPGGDRARKPGAAGTASATVRSTLQAEGDQTRVTVHTTLNVTGRPAQFGRGVMAEVGGKLIEKFAANLAAQLATGGPAAQTAPTAPPPPAQAPPPHGPGATAAQPATEDQSADASAGAVPPTSSELAAAAAARNGSVPGEEYSGDAAGMPIEELNLPVRSYNSLRREGVHTAGALASRNEKDLLAIDGLGPQSVKEIKQRLADHGLALGEPGVSPAAGPGHAAGPSRWRGTPPTLAVPQTPTVPQAPAALRALAVPQTTAVPRATTVPRRLTPRRMIIQNSDPSPRDRNGFLPSHTRPADEDSIDLLSVAGLPLLKRALPGIGILVGLLLLLGLRSRRKRRRARAGGF